MIQFTYKFYVIHVLEGLPGSLYNRLSLCADVTVEVFFALNLQVQLFCLLQKVLSPLNRKHQDTETNFSSFCHCLLSVTCSKRNNLSCSLTVNLKKKL